MIIACPNCQTTYDIAASAVPEGGRNFRCARCRHVWFVTPQAGDESPRAEPPHGADLALPRLPPASGLALRNDSDIMLGPVSVTPADAWPHQLMRQGTASGQALTLENDPPAVPARTTDEEALEALRAIEHVARKLPGDNSAPVAIARKAPPRSRWASAAAPLAIVLSIAALGALYHWRNAAVRAVPELASLFEAVGAPVNLRGLVFEDVKFGGEMQEGVRVLVVEGTLRNVTGGVVDVPRLRFAARDALQQEVYAWTAMPAKNQLAAGETLPFRTRLASPPAEGRDVIVRFFNKRDLMAQVQ